MTAALTSTIHSFYTMTIKAVCNIPYEVNPNPQHLLIAGRLIIQAIAKLCSPEKTSGLTEFDIAWEVKHLPHGSIFPINIELVVCEGIPYLDAKLRDQAFLQKLKDTILEILIKEVANFKPKIDDRKKFLFVRFIDTASV